MELVFSVSRGQSMYELRTSITGKKHLTEDYYSKTRSKMSFMGVSELISFNSFENQDRTYSARISSLEYTVFDRIYHGKN